MNDKHQLPIDRLLAVIYKKKSFVRTHSFDIVQGQNYTTLFVKVKDGTSPAGRQREKESLAV